MTNINEASLSRVWQHTTNGKSAIGILTAFRGEYTAEENVNRNKLLAANIRTLGYGFFYLDGYWIENQNTAEEQHVKEDSLFVIGKITDTAFANNIHSLGNKFEQEAVIVQDEHPARLIFKDNTISELGVLQPGSLGEIYSKLRRNKGTFIFKEERDDVGWIGRLADISK